MVFTKRHKFYPPKAENWREIRSELAKANGLGKHERTEEIKSKMYTLERNGKISNKLEGKKLSKQHIENIKKSHPQRGYYDQGYIRFGRAGIKRSRMNWEKHNGKIPKGYEIHHINSIRDDDRIENLQMLTKSEHAKITWAERR